MKKITDKSKKEIKTRIGYGRHSPWTAFSADKAQLDFYKGKKKVGHVMLKPLEAQKIFTFIQGTKKNPDRINFGIIHASGDTLSFVGYREQPEKVMLFLNLQSIRLDRDSWRKMFRIMNRCGHFLGILGRKKARKPRKKGSNSSTSTIYSRTFNKEKKVWEKR